MQVFHDRRTDRLFVTQPAHPVGASVLLFLAVLGVAGGIAIAWSEADWVLWLLCAACIGGGILSFGLSVQAFTEIVATFDGTNRRLTVSRAQPWRRSEQTFRYEDVADVAGRERMTLDAIGDVIWFAKKYSLEITLADDRRIRLDANGEAECHDIARQVYRLIRA